MRKALIAFVLAAVAGVALAQSNTATVSTSSALTVACTALAAGDGVSVSEAEGFGVTISADRPDAGVQTLIASGNMDCCFYGVVASSNGKASTYRWMDCPPGLDVSIATTCITGKRDCALGSFETPDGYGRIAYVPSAALVDGGATLTTSVAARRRK